MHGGQSWPIESGAQVQVVECGFDELRGRDLGSGFGSIGSLCVGVEALGGSPFSLSSITPSKGMFVL